MGVRGRSERIDFASRFEEVYHFRLLYSGTTFMFPILGGLRMTRHGGGRHVLFQRREGGGSERYEPVGCWLHREPTREELSQLVPNQVATIEEGGGSSDDAPPTAEVSYPAVSPTTERMPWD
mmetsp:Transcript_65228/g.145626  ORF Transcript_65228/g.145626 Transcript_65228/m.145626 type:complete len:122 (-) Transcript_65228:281-646(-)